MCLYQHIKKTHKKILKNLKFEYIIVQIKYLYYVLFHCINKQITNTVKKLLYMYIYLCHIIEQQLIYTISPYYLTARSLRFLNFILYCLYFNCRLIIVSQNKPHFEIIVFLLNSRFVYGKYYYQISQKIKTCFFEILRKFEYNHHF